MSIEVQEISNFIRRALNRGQTAKAVRDLNVDPEKLVPVLVEHFVEMGIYRIQTLTTYRLMLEQVHRWLRVSPEVRKIIEETRSREAKARAQKRVQSIND